MLVLVWILLVLSSVLTKLLIKQKCRTILGNAMRYLRRLHWIYNGLTRPPLMFEDAQSPPIHVAKVQAEMGRLIKLWHTFLAVYDIAVDISLTTFTSASE